MQIEYILGVLTIAVGFLAGYFIGKNNNYLSKRQKPFTTEEVGKAFERVKQLEENPTPEMPLGQEDIINHDGVGIVQRPTSEELARFAEPQQVKDAKAAISETLRNTPEIDSPTG